MTADSNAAKDSREVPSSGRAAVLRVGLRTADATLLQRMIEGLRVRGLPYDVMDDRSAAGRRHVARVLDLAEVPEPARSALLGTRDGSSSQELVLLMGDGELERSSGRPISMRLFPRKDVSALLRSLEEMVRGDAVDLEAMAFVGASSELQQVRERIAVAARFRDVPVLLVGESGTGKELAARELHRLTFGPGTPFLAVDGAALGHASWDAELFGDAGAAEGSLARLGLVGRAAGGTLFIDEVAELPAAAQAKLLRVLETRTYGSADGVGEAPLAARIVAATSRSTSLPELTLRRDLYYRLAGLPIVMPPLRARGEDLGPLSRHFLARFAERHGLPPQELSDDAIEALSTHGWPGNVRELRGFVEQLAMRAHGATITGADVAALLQPLSSTGEHSMTSPLAEEVVSTSRPMTLVASSSRVPSSARSTTATGATLKEQERDIVLEALAQSNGNLSRTARKLGIARSTLRHKLRRYGIETSRAQDDE